MRVSWIGLLVVVTACGSSPDTGDAGDAGDASVDAHSEASIDAHVVDVIDEPDAGFVEGPHGAFPQVQNPSGTTLTAPNVVPVFFASDALQTDLEDLLNNLPSSAYWTALRADYPVGPLTIAPSIVLSDTPPATATVGDVSTFIISKLDGNDPKWPPVALNNIYLMYYPSSTTLYDGSAVGCSGFAGYHSYWHTASNANFVFAAVSRCDSLATLDVATQNTTHEIVEAATDPLFGITPAYQSVDSAHIIWDYYPGGELGDMCEAEALSYERLIGTHLVARFWSNNGAKNGHDPCAPLLGDAYYNSVPVLNDNVAFTLYSQNVVTKGVTVPLGTSKTIDVQLFSDALTTPWTVQAQDASYLFGTGSPELTFTWDATTGNNADTLHLTITRVKNGASGGTEFVIYSQQSSSSYHDYFAIAGN